MTICATKALEPSLRERSTIDPIFVVPMLLLSCQSLVPVRSIKMTCCCESFVPVGSTCESLSSVGPIKETSTTGTKKVRLCRTDDFKIVPNALERYDFRQVRKTSGD